MTSDLRSVHTDRSDSYFVSDFDVGSIGTYSNIIGIGHFIGIGIGQCECTVKLATGNVPQWWRFINANFLTLRDVNSTSSNFFWLFKAQCFPFSSTIKLETKGVRRKQSSGKKR